MRKIFILFLIVSSISVHAQLWGGQKVVFDTSIASDASPAVLAQVLKAQNGGAVHFIFEKGTYHFYPDKALEHWCYISNHEDVVTRTAFPLFNCNNVIIDGQGSTFIFHGLMIPFVIEGGANLSFKNITIDWEVPFHAEGKIVATNVKESTIDMKFGPYDSYEIRNGELVFVKPYYEHTLGQSILFDPERRAVAYRANHYGISTLASVKTQFNIDKIDYKYKGDHQTAGQVRLGRESIMNAKELEPGLVRIHVKSKQKLPPVGLVLVGKGDKGLNRLAPAIRVTDVRNLNLYNVTVHHANGMGIICENSENIILKKFRVTPSKGRVLSTTADATHFVGCRGKIVLDSCLLECQMDDATNIHGAYQEVMDVIDEHTLGIRVGHFEQQMFKIGRPGDKIGLIRISRSLRPYKELTLNSIQLINGRYQKLTFSEKLPLDIQPGDLIENFDAYPEVQITNCTARGNRARGFLISTPRSTLIENNYFSNQMEAILMPVENSSWYESGAAANVIIRNNVFEDCNHGGSDRGVICFRTDEKNHDYVFRNIRIENNTFNQFGNLILEIVSADGLIFTHNKITCSETFPALYPDSPVYLIRSSAHLVFTNNEYLGKASKIFDVDDPGCGLWESD